MQYFSWRRWQKNGFAYLLITIISLLVTGCSSSGALTLVAPTAAVTITPTLTSTPAPKFTVTTTATSAAISTPVAGLTVYVNMNGTYTITTSSPAWNLSGSVGYPLEHITVTNGIDRLGSYREIQFTYQGKVARMSSIRSYGSHPALLFSTTYLAGSSNSEPFPVFSRYPRDLYHLSYHGTFSRYVFSLQSNDGPWVFFDKQANSLILSPAANFMVARMSLSQQGAIASVIDSGIETLPLGFTHQTMLTFGHGINTTFEAWGHAMTDLGGKVRLANDSNVTLNKLGYWTDNGAGYYYNYIRPLGYAGTLKAIVDQFASQGTPFGYLQLDSWWYDKGFPPQWSNGKGGISTYTADPLLFPKGLAAFQKEIGLPLVTHGRWIDPRSPYRSQYTISGNVSTDPRYWKSVMSYLHNSGVITYEQDWLSAQAASETNLTDPNAWMSAMASSANQYGLTLQYCMPDPHHLLQSTMYSTVVTARVSNDHFIRDRWDDFLYDSRLASALGVWPWTDVFMSKETYNLLISTLSAGMVGIGDKLGTGSKVNLMQTVRPDGVIVKPDTSIVPLDATYLAEVQNPGAKPAMLAAAYSYHTNISAAYVFAYSRAGRQEQPVSFTPASLGMNSNVYVYNYFTNQGQVVKANQTFRTSVDSNGSYYVVVPIGPSGIAFLGDAGKFVSLGSKRISSLSDDGTVSATVSFANHEGPVTLHGYAPSQPILTSTNGTISVVSYDPTLHSFSFTVSAGKNNSANINLSL